MRCIRVARRFRLWLKPVGKGQNLHGVVRFESCVADASPTEKLSRKYAWEGRNGSGEEEQVKTGPRVLAFEKIL